MFRVKPEGRHPVQDGVDDLIHDEGEELQDGAEDVVPRLEREAAFRQAAPKDDMTPEELENLSKSATRTGPLTLMLAEMQPQSG